MYSTNNKTWADADLLEHDREQDYECEMGELT